MGAAVLAPSLINNLSFSMRGKKTTSNYLDSKRGETEGNLRKV
jgi:hypothetical protein